MSKRQGNVDTEQVYQHRCKSSDEPFAMLYSIRFDQLRILNSCTCLTVRLSRVLS